MSVIRRKWHICDILNVLSLKSSTISKKHVRRAIHENTAGISLRDIGTKHSPRSKTLMVRFSEV